MYSGATHTLLQLERGQDTAPHCSQAGVRTWLYTAVKHGLSGQEISRNRFTKVGNTREEGGGAFITMLLSVGDTVLVSDKLAN